MTTITKEEFLELIGLYFSWEEYNNPSSIMLQVSKSLLPLSEKLSSIKEYAVIFQYINQNLSNPEEATELKLLFVYLMNRLLEEFDFDNSPNIPNYIPLNKTDSNKPTITVDILTENPSDSDLLISNDELITAFEDLYPLNAVTYPRLFMEAKLERITKEDIQCAVCGLSYTQHGIVENCMPMPTVNLSVSGQDIPYSLLMAQKILNMSDTVKNIIIPIAYYQGFYDISSDTNVTHMATVSCLLAPLLGDKRNYPEEIVPDGYIKKPSVFHIYDKISDLTIPRERRDKILRSNLGHAEFFNEYLSQSPTGGLKFDYHELKGQERLDSAAITEKLNRRVATYSGLEEVLTYLERYTAFITGKNIRTIFFVPPFTKELCEATEKNSRLKELFYTNIVPKIEAIPGSVFLDYFDSPEFDESDFVDFEHLDFYTGGKKLTQILGKFLI